MSPSLDKLRLNKRLMAYTAAAMYGGAAFDGSIEGFLPGDPSFAILPVLVSIAITVLLVVFGPKLPRWGLAPLGGLGVVLIAYALTATTGAGDGAVLYMWPVLWATFFFGRRPASHKPLDACRAHDCAAVCEVIATDPLNRQGRSTVMIRKVPPMSSW